MKHLLIGAAAAAALFAALPASAEVVVRGPGAAVVVGHGHHYGHRYGYRDRAWRHHYAGCRTVRTKTRLPNGHVITRTRRTC